MNEQITSTNTRTTQFADGLPRRSWTVAEFRKAGMLGLFAGNGLEDERLELLGGEILPMSPKGSRHELVRNELLVFWYRNRNSKANIIGETPIMLSDDALPQPDLIVVPPNVRLSNLMAADVRLVVEVADTSLLKDTRAKAQLYAAAGIRDYWVINAATLATTIFRDPSPTGYQSHTEFTRDEILKPLETPELALALGELGI